MLISGGGLLILMLKSLASGLGSKSCTWIGVEENGDGIATLKT